MQRFLVNQTQITDTRLEEVSSKALRAGEARLRVNSFALTANNVTYAASGFAIGYWKFFPTGVEGQGIVPVWGTAEVVETRSDLLPLGTRLYGYYPMAEELIVMPKDDGHGVIVDAAQHRADLPAVYNQYVPLRASGPDQEHTRALLQPLLATSYLLFDWLMDNASFGAEQIIVGSASSKTGLGLCKFLAEPEAREYRIIGLTSERNKAFVEGLNACDQVMTYDAVRDIPKRASVYVDMSGNAAVKQDLHETLGDHLKHSSAVGISHWDQFKTKLELAGPKPEFFFAPGQIAKRRKEWGPGEIEGRISSAWKRLAEDASEWMDVKVHHGLSTAPQIYQALADGTANPREGHIIDLT
ncbi:MAG: DUF2855 family protein [Pseudomonadota bacterium]